MRERTAGSASISANRRLESLSSGTGTRVKAVDGYLQRNVAHLFSQKLYASKWLNIVMVLKYLQVCTLFKKKDASMCYARFRIL